jgi:hypothetical protein
MSPELSCASIVVSKAHVPRGGHELRRLPSIARVSSSVMSPREAGRKLSLFCDSRNTCSACRLDRLSGTWPMLLQLRSSSRRVDNCAIKGGGLEGARGRGEREHRTEDKGVGGGEEMSLHMRVANIVGHNAMTHFQAEISTQHATSQQAQESTKHGSTNRVSREPVIFNTRSRVQFERTLGKSLTRLASIASSCIHTRAGKDQHMRKSASACNVSLWLSPLSSFLTCNAYL